jgi:glycosyltransferase involved in cell wall biosynthesis
LTSETSSTLRLAHVIETLGRGGAEGLLADVVARLDARRFTSRVIALEAPADLLERIQACGTPVELLGISPRRHPLKCLVAIGAALRRFAPNVVHTHLYYANVLGRLAMMGREPRVVTTLHNPDYTYESRLSPLFAIRKILDRITGRRRNDLFVAVSGAVAADYQKHMGWPNIAVIPNGVDVWRFTPGPPGPESQHWIPGEWRLLSIGRLHPQKGHSVLMEALARLRGEGLAVGLVIAGDGPLRASLSALAEALSVGSSVRFLGAVEDVRGLLRSADAFVFPSRYEAFGVALLEAMACGCAVVASRTGGIPEIVREGESGILVPPGDPVAIADAIKTLIAQEGLRRRLRAGARERAMAFSVQHTVERLEAAYDAVAGRTHKGC